MAEKMTELVVFTVREENKRPEKKGRKGKNLQFTKIKEKYIHIHHIKYSNLDLSALCHLPFYLLKN